MGEAERKQERALDEIDRLSQKLTDRIKDIEDLFDRAAHVKAECETSDGVTFLWLRFDKAWMIAYVDGKNNNSIQPLVNAPREIRILFATHHIGNLYAAIRDAKSEKHKELNLAISTAQSFINQFIDEKP